MESKKNDFIENNPYLVYSPDAEVSYAGGDSPTPPEPPVGSKGIIYIIDGADGQYTIDGIYEVPVNAESLADGTLIDTSTMKKVESESYTMLEFKYDAGKFIFIKTSDDPISKNYTSVYQEGTSYRSGLDDSSGQDAEKGCWFIMPDIEFTHIDMDDPDIDIETIINDAYSNNNPIPIIQFYVYD